MACHIHPMYPFALYFYVFKYTFALYQIHLYIHFQPERPCRVSSVGSVSASRTVGREFASRPGHTKDHHKNGTNCLPAWYAMS